MGAPPFVNNPGRSTDSTIPTKPSWWQTFYDDCFDWEERAEDRGRVVTISARKPATADFQTFGQAWQRYRGDVSSTDPMIFQFDEGCQVPFDAIDNGLHELFPILVANHQDGGVVIRGRGPETFLFNPIQYADYYSQPFPYTPAPGSPVTILDAKVFIKDMTLGFRNGRRDGGGLQVLEKPILERAVEPRALTGTESICDIIDARLKADGYITCGSGSTNCIVADSSWASDAKTHVLVYNVYGHNQYDLLGPRPYYGETLTNLDDIKGLDNEDKYLIVADQCHFYADSRGENATHETTSNSDGFHNWAPGGHLWVRNSSIKGAVINRCLYLTGSVGSSLSVTSSRTLVQKSFIENCTFVFDSGVMVPAGSGHIVVTTQPYCKHIAVVDNCLFLTKRDGTVRIINSNPADLLPISTAIDDKDGNAVAGMINADAHIGFTGTAAGIELYMNNCTFIRDVFGLDLGATNRGLTKGYDAVRTYVISSQFDVPVTDASGVKLKAINCHNITVGGSAADLNWVSGSYNALSDVGATIEEL